MSKINCKSCGCPNEVKQGTSIVVCEACGTEQTVPSLDNERKTMLFNRANASRLKCDFEKALANYETILIDYPNDAEAHWGICLCRYGIEYVDDPKTKTKIPTCHRTLYNSIFDDIDYKEAINNCDVIAKRKYQEEAEYIDRIQKNILSISQKEQPYDIFICYKETDEIGHRTRDSYVAEDIYNELINKGYKVFFSRITLETKLGLEYEPIIFAALQSSKVMLVIGSKKEYFEAVWVKNEWSRYLSFMTENKGNKYMIPCYRDMEAYDMPDEFLSLQSQNLDRLGAKQDLIRAIDKIFNREEKKIETSTQTVVNGVNINALLKRVEILISDNDYPKANELLDEILNNDPENAKAYILLLVIELKLNKESDLINQENELTQYRNYNRALSFATGEYKKQIEGYNEKIVLRKKEAFLSNKYNSALNYIKTKDYTKAKEILLSIIDYKDSRQLIENIEIFKKNDIYYNARSFKQRKYYLEAKEEFKKIIDYKDSRQLIEECNNLVNEERYNKAKQLITNEDYISAKQIFSSIINYKDSKELIEQCDLLVEQQKENKYNQAKQYIKEYKLYEALNILNIIKEYKDSQELIKKINILIGKEKTYQEAVKLGNRKTKQGFTSAISILSRIEDYRDSKDLINIYEVEILKMKSKKRKAAKKKFIILLALIIAILLYLILQVNVFTPLSIYNEGVEYLNNQEYYNALNSFSKVKKNYEYINEKIEVTNRLICLNNDNLVDTINYISSIDGEINITYDANGGNCVNTYQIIKGRSISHLIKPTKLDYYFKCWNIEKMKMTVNNGYVFTINLKAIWVNYKYEVYDIKIVEDYIYFGYYPQTLKEENVAIITTIPDKNGYYLGSDGERYAKVEAKFYNNSNMFSDKKTVIISGNIYYFKVEPIKWKIEKEYNGRYKLVCSKIIDCQMYYSSEDTRRYANNYEYSDIRKWLNNDFLNKAFTEELQAYINASIVDNSLSSTGNSTNKYICNNTRDKIYLPSVEEMTNSNCGYNSEQYKKDLAREKQLTDYAKALGCSMYTSSSYYNNGCYWLRTPYYDSSNCVRCISYSGYINCNTDVGSAYVGVVPVLSIIIK